MKGFKAILMGGVASLTLAAGAAQAADAPAQASVAQATGDGPQSNQAEVAQSQTPRADAPADDSTQGGLEDIIVTANKRSENLQSVPVAVTAIGGSILANAKIDVAENLGRLTPGLTVNRNANFVGLFLRGVGTAYSNPGLESSVAQYLDDTYLPRTSSAMFSFNDIERIEVLKGPQGTLYGRNAAAGTVKIVTRDPKIGIVEAAGSATAGSFNRFSADAMINLPLAANVAGRFTAIFDSNDGYVTRTDGRSRLQGRNLYAFTGKILADVTDTFKVKLSGDYGIKNDHEGQAFLSLYETCPQQIAVCAGGRPSTTFYGGTQDNPTGDVPGNKFRTTNYGVALRGDLDLNIGTLSSITAYRYNKFRGAADLDGTDIPFQHALTDGEFTKSFSQEVQLVSHNTGRFKYVFGLYYYNEKTYSDFRVYGLAINGSLGLPDSLVTDSAYTSPALNATSNIKIESIAPYAQASYDITDKITITAGLRYTAESKTLVDHDLNIIIPGAAPVLGNTESSDKLKFNKLTPKFVLDYKPIDDVLLYVSASRGFKSGGINSPAFNFPTDRVNPEVLDSYELGFKTEFGNVRFNGAAFYYDYNDLQVTQTNIQRCGGSCVVNAASAKVKGVEGDIVWAAAPGLEFGIGGSYLDTEFTSYLGDVYLLCATLPNPDPVTSSAAAQCATQGFAGFGIEVNQDLSGNPLPQAPSFTGYIRGSYTIDLASAGKVRLDGLYNHTGKFFYGPDASYLSEPAKNLATVSLTYTAPNDRYSIGAFVDNLFDVQYSTQKAQQPTGGWRVPGAPRTWGVKAGFRF